MGVGGFEAAGLLFGWDMPGVEGCLGVAVGGVGGLCGGVGIGGGDHAGPVAEAEEGEVGFAGADAIDEGDEVATPDGAFLWEDEGTEGVGG